MIPISATVGAHAAAIPLDEHLRRLEELQRLLQLERSALHQGEHLRVEQLAREKLPLLRGLGELLAQLQSGIVAGLQPRLRRLLAECLQLNGDNGALLEALAARSRQRLHRLKGSLPAQYDGRGHERFAIPGRVRGMA